jgi:hypothetical protein
MYTATELEDIAKGKIKNAQVSKPAIASKLKQDAAELRAYAHLIKSGWNETKFQKRLIKCEAEIERRIETFNQLLERNKIEAHEYHKDSQLGEFENEAKMLRFILEIEEVQLCK